MQEIKNQQTEQNKMGTVPISKLLFSMALPPMFSMFLQYTYNVVDCMFVSWLSQDALTAVSLAFPIQNLMLSVAIGAGVGCNTLIARKLGENNPEEGCNIVTHSLILAVMLTILFMIIGMTALKPFFGAFTTSPVIYELGISYTRIVTLVSFGCFVHIMIQKIVQATGNMLAPMLFQIAGALLNCILDPIMIFGLFGFPKMGVAGAALATVTGQLVSTALAFYVLIYTKLPVRIKIKNFKFNISILKDIIITGLPSLVMNALGAMQVLFINIVLMPFSELAVGMFGIYFKLQTLAFMTVNGLIQGALPIMSYNFGARNKKRLFDTLKTGLFFSALVLSIAGALFFSFPEKILGAFAATNEMIKIGVPCMKTISFGYIFAAFGFLIASYFQATKRVKSSLFINLLRQAILLLPLISILVNQFGIPIVWLAFPISEFATALIAVIMLYYYEKKDRSNQLKTS